MSDKPEWVYPISGLAWLFIGMIVVTSIHTTKDPPSKYNGYKTRPISQQNK